MRRFVMAMMFAGLLLQVGCEKSNKPAETTTDNPAEATPDPAAPQGAMPELESYPGEDDDPTAVTTATTNAVNRIAGRSPFPESNEDIEKPLPYKRLSTTDQFAEPIDPADIPAIVQWDQAKQYVGYEITVQGKIVSVGQTKDASVNFLNFHEDYRGKFYMVVFEDLAKTLPKSVEETFLNKTLRVKGTVEDHRGNPQIKITSMDQVQFVGE